MVRPLHLEELDRVFTNDVGYLMKRLTLAGGLQEVYIGGDDDPYHASLRFGPNLLATGLASLRR